MTDTESVQYARKLLNEHVDELVHSGVIDADAASELHSEVNDLTTAIQNYYDSI